MSDQLPADPSVRVVETLLRAVLRDKDFDVAGQVLADDVIYENVGYSTMRGGQRIVKTFRAMSARLPMVNWGRRNSPIRQPGNPRDERADRLAHRRPIPGRFLGVRGFRGQRRQGAAVA